MTEKSPLTNLKKTFNDTVDFFGPKDEELEEIASQNQNESTQKRTINNKIERLFKNQNNMFSEAVKSLASKEEIKEFCFTFITHHVHNDVDKEKTVEDKIKDAKTIIWNEIKNLEKNTDTWKEILESCDLFDVINTKFWKPQKTTQTPTSSVNLQGKKVA